MPNKQYLGDGVYATVQNDMIRLTAEDGITVQETIYLERLTYEALKLYAERVWPSEEKGTNKEPLR